MATTANDRWYDGAQWIVIGQLPATLVVPSAPTNLAVSPLQTQITVTCTIPGSNGGSAITGYSWSITPTAGGATVTATTSASVLTKTWTGLTALTTYTVTVAATNVVGTGPAVSTNAQTQAASSSSVIYGPDGSAYPTFTPTVNATVYATIALNDIAGLKAALRTVPSGGVILLSNGTWTAATINDATAMSHLAGLAQNVLIRPVTWGGATIDMKVQVPHTSWMGFTVNHMFFSGYPFTSTNADRSRLAQCKLPAQGKIDVFSNDDTEIVEVVALTRGVDADRIDIGTSSPAGGSSVHTVSNYRIVRCWLEGMDVVTGTLHIDNAQLLCQGGNNLISHTYFGAGGNSSSLSVSADEQYTFTPGTTTVTDNYVVQTPGANCFEMKGTNLITVIAQRNSVDSAVINTGTSANKTLYDLTHITFDSNSVKSGGLGGNYNPPGPFQSSFPSNTYGATITPPTFVNPPWWW